MRARLGRLLGCCWWLLGCPMVPAVVAPIAVIVAVAAVGVPAAGGSTPALRVWEVRLLLPLRGTAWSRRNIGRRRGRGSMIVVMGWWWPVARQPCLRGGLPVLVGAPSCPGFAMGSSARSSMMVTMIKSAIDVWSVHTGLQLGPIWPQQWISCLFLPGKWTGQRRPVEKERCAGSRVPSVELVMVMLAIGALLTVECACRGNFVGQTLTLSGLACSTARLPARSSGPKL